MSELSTLKEAFRTGNAPVVSETKRFQKCMKKYPHIINPKFVYKSGKTKCCGNEKPNAEND